MNKAVSLKVIITILLFPLVAFPGCSSSKSIANVNTDSFSSVANRIWSGDNSTYKKRVLVLNFINQAEFKEDSISKLTDKFLEILKEDESLLVSRPDRPIPTSISKDSSQYGVVIDPVIVKKAEEMNMDILIMPTLNPVDVSLKRKGIWPLRKLRRDLEIFISVTALDVTNGTLFLANIENRKVKLKDEVWEEDLDTWELDENLVVQKLIPLLEDLASSIHNVLRGKPWTGKIIKVEGSEITVNGGKDIGIKEGITLDAFGKGEPIKAFNGNIYHTRGPKVGEIKINMVKKDYSVGSPISGDQFEIGQTLRSTK